MWWKDPNNRQVDPATLHLRPQGMQRPVLIAPFALVAPPVAYHRITSGQQFAFDPPEDFGSELCFRSQPLDPETIAVNGTLDQAAWENQQFSLRSEFKAMTDQANRSLAETRQSLCHTVFKLRIANQFLQDTSEHSQLLQSHHIQFADDIQRLESAIRDRSYKNLKLRREHQHLRVALDETRSSETELRILLRSTQVQLDDLRNDQRIEAVEKLRSLTRSNQKFRLASWLLQDTSDFIQSLQSLHHEEIERLELAIREKSDSILKLHRDQQHFSQSLETTQFAESQLRVSLAACQNRLDGVQNELHLKTIENQQSHQKLRFAIQLVQDSSQYTQCLQSQHRMDLEEIERLKQVNRQKTELILESQRNQQQLQDRLELSQSVEIDLRSALESMRNQFAKSQVDSQWQLHELQSDWSAERQYWQSESHALIGQVGQLASQLHEFEQLKIRSCEQEQQLHEFRLQLADAQARENATRSFTESLKHEAAFRWRSIEQRVVQSRRQRAARCTFASQRLVIAIPKVSFVEPESNTEYMPASVANGVQSKSFRNGIQRQIQDFQRLQYEAWNSMRQFLGQCNANLDTTALHGQTKSMDRSLNCSEVINRLLDEAQAELPLGVSITRNHWNWLQHQKTEFAKMFAEIRDLQQELSFQHQQSEQYRLESDQLDAQVLEMAATIQRLSQDYALLDELFKQTSNDSILERESSERLIAQQESELIRFEHHVECLRKLIRQGRRRARQTIERLENTIYSLQQNFVRRAA